MLENTKEYFPSPKRNGHIDMKKLYNFIDELMQEKEDEME